MSKVAPLSEFPKVMIVMTPFQFLQAFSQTLMVSVKAMFLKNGLGYTENVAVLVSHIYVAFEPIPQMTGAILADSKYGKWKIIVAGLILMRIGDVFFVLCVIPWFPQRELYLVAQTLFTALNIYLPTLNAFYSEQFKMPSQERLLKIYYNVTYWGKNLVSILGSYSGSRLAELHCLGERNCYALPFWLWVGTESFMAVLIISLGPMFIRRPPTFSVTLHFVQCVTIALKNQMRYRKEDPRDRWIDYADEEFEDEFRNDCYRLMNISYFFIISVFYWSLYDQMFSRFIYQCTRLNGHIIDGFNLYPGDVFMLNPILVIILLPLLEYIVYPLCYKCGILTTDLQKVATSDYLIATAFIAATVLQYFIDIDARVPPQKNKGSIYIFNALTIQVQIEGGPMGDVTLPPLSFNKFENLNVKGLQNFVVTVKMPSKDPVIKPMVLEEKKGTVYVVSDEQPLERVAGHVDFSSRGDARLAVLCLRLECGDSRAVSEDGKVHKVPTSSTSQGLQYLPFRYGVYSVETDNAAERKYFGAGGVYTALSREQDPKILIFETVKPNEVSFLWILPQMFLLTLGEIMHAIPWRLFIYTQSPPSMRSVVFAMDLLSRSLGDLLIALVALSDFLPRIYEFLMYAILMYLVSIFFSLLAVKYTPQKSHE